MTNQILIADDDTGVLSALNLLLKSEGYSCTAVESPEQTLSELRRQEYQLLIMDLNYSLDTTSGEEGLKLINEIRKLDEYIPIIVMTGWGSIEVAVDSMKYGANDFIQKPWENDRLLAIINNQLKLAKAQKQSAKLSQQNRLLEQQANPDTDIITQSPNMLRVLNIIKQVAKSDVSVLFTGENGTGKSMFARHLHKLSARKDANLICVNMGAVTESLFESEMFGHTKGAFTDAKSSRIGRFELADEGTLFLDEIANTPYSQQGKLLRVLEENQFEKVGSSKTQTVDIRLIAATNANLNDAVEKGEFRKDLLYRINTIEIKIPALRERQEDIIPLANSFLSKAAKKYAQAQLDISPQAATALQQYEWPGNVRELGHVMERAQILCQGKSISMNDLGLNIELENMAPVANETSTNVTESIPDLRTLTEIEADVIEQRLSYFSGDALKAAQSLDLSRSAFYRRWGKAKE